MSDVLAEIDRPDGIIPVTPESVGALVGEIRLLRAALGAMWRPIEEYDKTSGERVVLGIERNGRIEETHVGYFSWAVNDDEESLWWSEQADDEICPTHFMPLPVPPPMGRG